MKTNKWIYAIVVASLCWVACDDDDDPVNKPDLNDADETFVELAARSNMAEVKFGELATTKATDSLVKAYAQNMVTAHTSAQAELKGIADDFNGVEWPNDLDEGHDAILESLNNASGYSFDTLYIKTQIKLHEDASARFQAASGNTTEARVKAYATKYLPQIQAHLQEADSLESVIITIDIINDTTD